jgi:dTMP kinase
MARRPRAPEAGEPEAAVLVAFEGIDGAGKTSLIRGVEAHLVARGLSVTRVRRYMVPEITALWWQLVAEDAVDQQGTALLAAADYRAGLARVIRPALAAGHVVLADKYWYSHQVYFGLRGISFGVLAALFPEVLEPQLAFHLVLPVEMAFKRLAAHAGKPDLLECALDHRLGLTIGEAFRRYGLGGAPAELREAHFLDHQAAAAGRYAAVVPPDRTRVLDATADAATLLADCLAHLDLR